MTARLIAPQRGQYGGLLIHITQGQLVKRLALYGTLDAALCKNVSFILHWRSNNHLRFLQFQWQGGFVWKEFEPTTIDRMLHRTALLLCKQEILPT